MARPEKPASERKTAEVRIPVTDEQKKLITEAATAEQADVATWARPLLLGFAQQRLGKRTKRGTKQ